MSYPSGSVCLRSQAGSAQALSLLLAQFSSVCLLFSGKSQGADNEVVFQTPFSVLMSVFMFFSAVNEKVGSSMLKTASQRSY